MRKSVLISVIIVVVGGLGSLIVWDRIRHAPLPEGLLQGNGRIEGDTISVAGKYPGKVKERLVDEGAQVEKDDLILRLDSEEVEAKIKQADAVVKALEAQYEAARLGLDILRRQVPLGEKMAVAQVKAREAGVEVATAAEAQLRKDRDRLKALADKGSVDQHRSEEVQLRWKATTAELTGAKSGLEAARRQLDQAMLGYDQIVAKETELGALAAQLERAQAGREEAQVALDNLSLYAPATGTVIAKLVEPGEVVAAGTPVVELVNMNSLYLKVYIAGKHLGKLKLNLPARIYIDAYPDRPFHAKVGYIARRAEFTPKEVQTQEERTKQVYAVKLYFKDEEDSASLTPGMPADAVIRWNDSVPWQKPKW